MSQGYEHEWCLQLFVGMEWMRGGRTQGSRACLPWRKDLDNG